MINKILVTISTIILLACSSQEPNVSKKYYDLIIRDHNNYVDLDTDRINDLAVDLVISGSTLQQQNKYAEAILEFQQALKYDSSASILFAISKSYASLYKYDMALEYVVASLDKVPKFIPAMELLTDLYFAFKRVDDAITVYQEILVLDPSRSRRINLAKLYEYKDPVEAVRIYEELLEQKEDAEILSRLTKLYAGRNDSTKLLTTFEKLIKSSSNVLDYDGLIRTYLDNKFYSKAQTLLDTIRLKFSQEDVNYFFSLVGNTLLDDTTSQAKNSIPEYLSKINNDFYFDWRINMISGYLSNRIKDTAGVNKYFDRALVNDTLPDIILAISIYYSQNNNPLKALDVLSKNESKFPDNFNFPLYKGTVYLELNEPGKALYELQKAHNIDTNNIEVWGQIGLVYDRMRKYDSCDLAYNKVLSADPENPLINNNYAYSLAVRGENLELALKMSSTALTLEPDNSSYLDTYGWIQYKLGNFRSALEYVLKAMNSGEINNPEAYEHLGYIYLGLDLKEKAIEALQKAIDLGSTDEDVMMQLNLLKK